MGVRGVKKIWKKYFYIALDPVHKFRGAKHNFYEKSEITPPPIITFLSNIRSADLKDMLPKLVDAGT